MVLADQTLKESTLNAKLLDLVNGLETPESWRDWWNEHNSELEGLLSRGGRMKNDIRRNVRYFI